VPQISNTGVKITTKNLQKSNQLSTNVEKPGVKAYAWNWGFGISPAFESILIF
jgi:hypothetical protein